MAGRATRMSSMVTSQPTAVEAPALARTSMLRLLRGGLNPTEAANVTAVSIGLRPAGGGWSIQEIERLRFLRYLAESARLAQ